MARSAPSFDPLLRAATGRRRLAPLLRALGFAEPEPVPPATWGGFGLADGADDPRIRALLAAGERGGLRALVIELDDAGPEATARVARRVRAHNPARPCLFVFADRRFRRLVFASFGLGDELRLLAVDRDAPRRSDLEALEELAAEEGEGGVALALRHARALDRSRVTRQFFRDFRAQRTQIAAAWSGVPSRFASDRDGLALLLLSRLVFLYFLQKRGHLAGDPAYLPGRLAAWRQRPGEGTFYRAVLVPLFFGALNTRPERRSAEARALGALPYLNGGLFERHALEHRHPGLDLPDPAIAGAFDNLLERYRFTTREAAEAAADGAGDVGVDPEMLGRVFEELMAADRRSASGSYYTPSGIVDRLVRAALETHLAGTGLDAATAARLVREGTAHGIAPDVRRDLARRIAGVRVLDPACGSGAFLLGALTRLTRLRTALGERDRAAVRRDIIGHGLHGVDVQDDAALLCALRLWLALAVEEPAGDVAIQPLPNLDRRIRQGDALLDPIDLVAGAAMEDGPGRPQADASVFRALRAIPPLASRYLGAGPEERPAIQRALTAAEGRLADAWLDAISRRLDRRRRDLAALADARDLFGERPAFASRAEREAADIAARLAEAARLREQLEEAGSLPFFSFGVHFAEAAENGFDLILSNPPWVRAHRWPSPVRRLVRSRYAVCRNAGWRRGAALMGAPGGVAGQVDLSLLFLERSVRLLAQGGTLAMLLPAKAMRSLYGAGARRLLLAEMTLTRIEDHSLDHRSIFRADVFAAAVVARKREDSPSWGGHGRARTGTGIGSGTSRGVGTGYWTGTGNDIGTENGPGAGNGSGAAIGVDTGCSSDRASSPYRRDAAASASPSARAPWSRPDAPMVRITMVHRRSSPLQFCLSPDELPLFRDDPESPWLLAPPGAREALRRMQRAGPPLGRVLPIRRGVVTGANDVLIFRHVEPKLSGLALVRALGHDRIRREGGPSGQASRFRALVEEDALRPLVRGADLAAWRFRTTDHVCWIHDDDDGEPRQPPTRLARYLARHEAALRSRTGERPGRPPGALFRLSPATLGAKVAWHDLALDLGAVALPTRVRWTAGRDVPLIPLNTVYFVPTRSEERSLLLAAYLNSLPVRVFARAIAERAKDARFRFLAWTIALVPLPDDWDRGPGAERLGEISARAHEHGAILPDDALALDRIVASRYQLRDDDTAALASFDLWLRGVAP